LSPIIARSVAHSGRQRPQMPEPQAPLPDYVPVTPPRRSFLARVAEWLFGGSKEAV